MRLRFFINSKILKIIFVAICFFIYSFIVVKPARATDWDELFEETESEGYEKIVSYKELIKREKVPAYGYRGCDPIKNGFSCVDNNSRCVLTGIETQLLGRVTLGEDSYDVTICLLSGDTECPTSDNTFDYNLPIVTGELMNSFPGTVYSDGSFLNRISRVIDPVFTCNRSDQFRKSWLGHDYWILDSETDLFPTEGCGIGISCPQPTHEYKFNYNTYSDLFSILNGNYGRLYQDLNFRIQYNVLQVYESFRVYPAARPDELISPPNDCGSPNYIPNTVNVNGSNVSVCMRKGKTECSTTGNTFCNISYADTMNPGESYDVEGKCVLGDICHKKNNSISYCSPSNNEVNLYSGATCISQSINPAIYNTKRTETEYDPLLGGYACGSNLSLQNATESGDGYFIMCEKGTHCVANNGSRGSFFNTFYGDVLSNTGQNLPSVGSCFGLSECISDVGVDGKNCSTNSLGPNPYNFIDNCCHPEFFCKPNSPGSSTAGTCQTKNFEVCTEERTSETKLNVSPTEFIMPGEICKYGSDGDYCYQCSTSTTFDDGSNKRCGQVVTQIDPVLGSEITINCKSDCACPSGKKCDSGKCVLSNVCASEGEACSAEKRCCNSGQYSCKSNPSSDDGSSTCELNCENPGVTCNPNDPIRNACCLDKYCGSNGRCVISNRCNGKNEDECCGYNSKCDASGDCIQAPDGDVCKTDTILSKDPIKRPTKSMNLYELLTSITAILYPLAIILGMGYLIMGGYKLMSSQGSPEAVKGAQEMISSAIIGMVFIILSATILRFVLELLIEVSL